MANNYLEWFKKGDEDEFSIQKLLEAKGHPNTICFLSQQLAEKYLKGLLVFHNIPFQKVHDLLTLETLLSKTDSTIISLHEIIVRLNRFYIETRYPGNYPEFSWSDALSAFQDALAVKNFCLKKTAS